MWIRALLSTELAHIFANAPTAPNSVLNPRVQAAYSKALGQSSTEGEAETATPAGRKRKIEENDDCPICYEGIHGIDEKSLVFCRECGNAVHKVCFQQCKHMFVALPLRINSSYLVKGKNLLVPRLHVFIAVLNGPLSLLSLDPVPPQPKDTSILEESWVLVLSVIRVLVCCFVFVSGYFNNYIIYLDYRRWGYTYS